MRICLACLLSSPTIAPILHLVHVEALLLLPRNQLMRRRFKVLIAAWSLAHFNHSDPYSEDDVDADHHPDVIAAQRPLLGIEAMLTIGRYQEELALYRQALATGNYKEAERLELLCAPPVPVMARDRSSAPLHAV